MRRKDQAPAVRNNQGWRVTAEIRAEMNAGAIETGEAPLAATLGPVLPGAPALHASSGERPLNACNVRLAGTATATEGTGTRIATGVCARAQPVQRPWFACSRTTAPGPAGRD